MASARPGGPCSFPPAPPPPERRGTKAEEQEGLVSPSKEFQNPGQQRSRGSIWIAGLAKPMLPTLLVMWPAFWEGPCSWNSKPSARSLSRHGSQASQVKGHLILPTTYENHESHLADRETDRETSAQPPSVEEGVGIS